MSSRPGMDLGAPAVPSRFEIVRHLGSGGMGTVFEAIDRERNARVALKTLRAKSPDALLQLKNEFRTLQDIVHENLVDLLDLIEQDGRFFVVMELVHGSDFLAYIRPGSIDPTLSGLSETRPVRPRGSGESLSMGLVAPGDPAQAAPLDEARLRNALGQLARALSALHDHGKVHRDVKPGNVLVTASGRVVLVDFGLAADITRDPLRIEASGGTRAFMAPEQAAGQAVTSAADWYSFGVVLELALTGTLPFHGADLQRQKLDARFRRELILGPDVPEDLARLALELLDPDPGSRPGGRDVLERLGVAQRAPAAVSGIPFVGRKSELAQLLAAVSRSRSGATTVLVVGDSGLGKSALVRELCARLSRLHPGALVLSGRCYERELVPYKAFDGIVDALSHFLRSLAEREAARSIPEDAWILTRIFPVLERVPALARQVTTNVPDPQQLRALGFAALRELFARIAAERPVLLFIDDLQWADADSYLLLADLLSGPDAPRVCVVATARAHGESGADPESSLVERCGEVVRLPLSPLSFDDARALASAVLGAASEPLARAIARETGGHPLFLQAMAEHAKGAAGFEPGSLRLEDALFALVEHVDAAARLLLELVSVAGAPLATATAAHAAGQDALACAASVASLRVARLVRTSSGDAEGRLEPYHDRIRETVLARLDSGVRRERHRMLAEAMQATGRASADPQSMLRHLEGAGRLEQAAEQAELAARQAESALAFDRAAEFYRTALRLGRAGESSRRALTLALAEALTNAGRAAEAASAYLEVAATAEPERRLEYRRRAADHMLRSGHMERGSAILSEVLRELGDDLMSQRRSLFTTLFQRLRLRFRGLSWTPRDPSQVPAELLRRIEAYHAVGVSLALIDPIRGGAFEARALHLALDAGEPLRLAPVLLMEAGYEASVGARGLASARRLLVEARHIVEITRDPYVRAVTRMIEGFLDYHAGKFAAAAQTLGEIELAFRDLPGTYFERAFCHCFRLICNRNRGLFGELARGFADWIRDAERRGDRFTEASLRFNLNGIWLARDEPDEALRDLGRVSWIPPRGGYHVQHWYEQQARAEIALYTGRAPAGLFAFRQQMKALSKSFILRMRLHRAHARWLLGRLILASAGQRAPGREPLDEVARLAEQLRAENVGYARTWSLLLTAAVERRRGRERAAVSALEAGVGQAERHGLLQCEHAARYGLAGLVRGGRGAELEEQALRWALTQQIRKPEHLFESWAPGLR